jgi:hypothetical protein
MPQQWPCSAGFPASTAAIEIPPQEFPQRPRLLRAYATQVETLRRLKNGGSQVLRVEHVHVNEGGQALIGNVRSER